MVTAQAQSAGEKPSPWTDYSVPSCPAAHRDCSKSTVASAVLKTYCNLKTFIFPNLYTRQVFRSVSAAVSIGLKHLFAAQFKLCNLNFV